MKLVNNIGWCDVTANRVIGCDKVSEGCRRCYAQNDTPARVLRHRGIETWGAKGTRVVVEGFAKKVRRLNKFCICDKCRELQEFDRLKFVGKCQWIPCGGKLRRIRIFADSNSDWLDLKWQIETFADLLRDIHECPNIDFLLLTKRPQNFVPRLHDVQGISKDYSEEMDFTQKWLHGGDPKNVWIGVSVENQKAADERIPLLRQIPAKVRFLSCEPLLENIEAGFLGSTNVSFPSDFKFWSEKDRDQWFKNTARATYIARLENGIQWVICGGESGNGFRDMPLTAAESLHDQCAAAGVAFYMKQDSARKNGERGRIPDRIWKQQFPVLA